MVTPPPIQVASLGMADSLILMVMALVVFGPRRLPQIGRQIGKLMYEFRKASNDFKYQMEEELRNSEQADQRKQEEERLRRLATPAQPASADAPAAVLESVPDGQFPVPSPYPGEEVYPPVHAEEAPAEGSLTVQPPSTGELVPAARPGSVTTEEIALPDGRGDDGPTASDEAYAEEEMRNRMKALEAEAAQPPVQAEPTPTEPTSTEPVKTNG